MFYTDVLNSVAESLPALASWLDYYHDPLFLPLIVGTLYLSIAAFLLFAIPWTLLAYLDPKSLQKFKIQQKPFQVKKYLLPNLGRIIINSTIMLLLLILSWPLFLQINTVYTGNMPAWYIIIAQLVFFIFLDDFIYYWLHRSMHHPWLLKHVHGVHHRIKNTCALDGNYFHWAEFVATGAIALIPPLIVGAHLYVLWIWIIIRQFEAADGHCGYDLPKNPVKLIPFYHGAVYHDFHHARFKGNYSGFLSYLDRFMGQTYIASYLDYVKNRHLGMPPAEANPNNKKRK